MKQIIAVLTILLLAISACSPAAEPVADPAPTAPDQEVETVPPRVEQEEEIPDPIESTAVEGPEVQDISTEISYANPGGVDTMILTLSLNNGIIEDFEIEEVRVGRTASRYIAEFEQVAPEYLIGKSLDEVAFPTRLAGASLTSAAFNEAFAELKDEA